ncbi:MAG: hypothetical protein GAK31_00257 [Stenotrophomonas maltophilia]|uniref:NAD(P)-binding domain-containing protein n=1 Tax=Stenotrophomonas maltophilia TaxID=40324 RepID=A0A7V8FIY6_STEMA|nr:MAG: hypothetical protein GAK31_00257 [Stenotrophomonas maltophilia]
MTITTPLSILLAGATGLVGQGVLQACVDSPHVGRVVSLVRRRGSTPGLDGNTAHRPAVAECVLGDFADAQSHTAAFAGLDACLYCVGAPPLGTPEAEYHRVTVELTLAVARAYAQANPHGRFLYVSGAHADAHSRVMPLRIKGEVEQALQQLPLRTVMLRPGGVRPVAGTQSGHAWMKPFYTLGRPLMGLTEQLLPSLVVSNLAIGRAMLALARSANAPAIVECADIHHWAR